MPIFFDAFVETSLSTKSCMSVGLVVLVEFRQREFLQTKMVIQTSDLKIEFKIKLRFEAKSVQLHDGNM